VKAGLTLPLLESKGSKLTHQLRSTLSLGYYFQPGAQHGVFLSSDWAYQLTFAGGLFIQPGVGVGFNRTFHAARVFEITPEGEARRIPLAGSNYVMPSASFTVGHQIREHPWIDAWYVSLGNFWQYPFNQHFLANPYLELGLRLHLPG